MLCTYIHNIVYIYLRNDCIVIERNIVENNHVIQLIILDSLFCKHI